MSFIHIRGVVHQKLTRETSPEIPTDVPWQLRDPEVRGLELPKTLLQPPL